VVPAVCLVVVNFAACNEELVFAFFGIGTTFMGGMFSGFLSNHIDIAPQFAGNKFVGIQEMQVVKVIQAV
jgi:ACS family sodium-dependent inorganic phosphate cotransporter